MAAEEEQRLFFEQQSLHTSLSLSLIQAICHTGSTEILYIYHNITSNVKTVHLQSLSSRSRNISFSSL